MYTVPIRDKVRLRFIQEFEKYQEKYQVIVDQVEKEEKKISI